MFDERHDAAVVMKSVALAVALVGERDQHAGIEKRELAQTLGERVEAELRCFEDLRIGLECNLRAALLRRPGDGKIAERLSPLVRLLVHLLVAPDLEIEPL